MYFLQATSSHQDEESCGVEEEFKTIMFTFQ